MSAASVVPAANELIAGLPRLEREQLLARCETVTLTFGSVLCEPDERYRHVYFPLSGFISLVALVSNHAPMELGLIGSEGMLGETLALGINVTPLRAIVQGPGLALRLSAAHMRAALAECPKPARTIGAYLYVRLSQLAQGAACSRFHEVEPRLARWLLLTHDCAHADHFHLTHQFLADMLGVQRSAITIAAGALQRRQLIHYSRGEIDIVSRDGLEAAACECYAAAVSDYAERFGKRRPLTPQQSANNVAPTPTSTH
jgi:CRP-like cAMP-binding protein